MGVQRAVVSLGLLLSMTTAAANEYAATVREQAERTLSWQSAIQSAPLVPLQILAINDFHSQMSAGEKADGRPLGSAPVLAAYLRQAEQQAAGATMIVHAGDHVGASQPEATLMQDEPGVMFFNMLGNKHCRPGGQYDEQCNLLGIPGNHELDEGLAEMLRMIYGGEHPQKGSFFEKAYTGANFPYLCVNLLQTASGKPLLRPSLVKDIDGVPVAFIGAILRQAGAFLTPETLTGLTIEDEAVSINREVRRLREQGVRAFVVSIHQGGYQIPLDEQKKDEPALLGDIAAVVEQLENDVDVVLGGHTHTYHNILLDRGNGRKMLVSQAWPKGTGFTDIGLQLDRQSGEVVAITSRVVSTWADQGAGLFPDEAVAQLTAEVERIGGVLTAQVVARADRPITRAANAAGESALGDLVADAHRQAMGADFAFINTDGIHADILPGGITKGDHFTVQPYQLNLIKLELTGGQIYDLLNQQWGQEQAPGRFLQVSGLQYVWDAARPIGQRVVVVMQDGAPIDPVARYTVAVNEHLAGGGDDFTVLTQGRNPVVGPFVAEALLQYVQALPHPLRLQIAGRIARIN